MNIPQALSNVTRISPVKKKSKTVDCRIFVSKTELILVEEFSNFKKADYSFVNLVFQRSCQRWIKWYYSDIIDLNTSASKAEDP